VVVGHNGIALVLIDIIAVQSGLGLGSSCLRHLGIQSTIQVNSARPSFWGRQIEYQHRLCSWELNTVLWAFMPWENTIEQLLCSNLVICWINCLGCLLLLWHHQLSNWKGCNSCH